jgi:integrase
MTLVKRGNIFAYDFWYRGRRYQASTEQTNRADAQLVEDAVKQRLRRETHGLISAHPEDAPAISEFALVYFKEQEKRLTRPDVLERTLRMVLGFWGQRPKTKKNQIVGAPYHNLKLSSPIVDPRWLDRFEQWMDKRELSGSTRNSYLAAMSGMYKLAANHRYRSRTGIDRNPFTDVGRHPTRVRQVTASKDDVLTWIQHGAPHFILAVVIGALAHKLRVSQVLELRFDRHIDPDLTRITFDAHKTIRHTRKPQVTVISTELRRVLEAIKKERPKATYVITWRGQPVKSLRTAAEQAAKRAKLTYGLQDGAVTFHALRHISSTELARMGISAALAAKAGGHLDPRTTEKHYTHLIDSDEQIVVDQLGTRLGLADTAIAAARIPAKQKKSAVH